MLIKNLNVDMEERTLAALLALPYDLDVDEEGHIVMTPLKPPGLTWDELSENAILPESLQWRVETDGQNRIIMSPWPPSDHQEYGSEIMGLLNKLLPHGKAIHECGIQTSNGTRIADIIWISAERRRAHSRRPSFRQAPEICVEVIPKSNTRREIKEKTELYLEAGASEVWTCDKNGNISFFNADGQMDQSLACPAFPTHVNPFD